MTMLNVGIKGYQEEIVTPELLACHIGSGTVRVFATPLMITLMERTCRLSVQPYLDAGFETVGTHVNVSSSTSPASRPRPIRKKRPKRILGSKTTP